jgi:adenylosuccinate synthase
MTLPAVVGVNWGDEGKCRVVDYLAQDHDLVVRYQGGNNAGHTVVNDLGTFRLHLIPSGIFNPAVTNVLGPGVIVDLEALVDELDQLSAAGIDTSNLRISDRATICFPFHRNVDIWEEERLGEARAYGSTRRGIAPAYADRYLK